MPQNPIDLTGQWEGHYQQHDVKYPIRATLEQHGDRLTGTMQDGVTEFTRSVFDAALLAGLPPGADEQIEEQLRRLHPDIGNAPIRSKSRLPSESALEGTSHEDSVYLVKTYQGECFGGFEVKGKEVGWTKEQHAVEYRGRIEGGGVRIIGFWTIPRSGSAGGVQQGEFLLKRAQATRS